MELSWYLDLFRRRAALILLVTFLTVDAAALATWFGPRAYEAYSLLQVRASSTAGTSYEDAEYVEDRMANYPPLVGSPAVVESAARASGVLPEEVTGAVRAANPPGTTQLQITGRSADAGTAARLADATAEAVADAIAEQEPGPVRVRAELLVPAAVPVRPASPNLTLNLAGGALAGVALGMLAALVCGGAPRVLRGADDVERVAGLELLAQLPPAGGRHLGGTTAEACFRELTASVLQSAGGVLPRILLLSSCCPGSSNAQRDLVEGWAGHLAAGGRRVGVLETATRPAATSGATAGLGWTDLLAGGTVPERIMVPVHAGQFVLVPVGGSADLLPAADLAARTGPMLHDLAARFDLLLVPTRPGTGPLNNTLLAPAVSAAVVLACYCETTDEQLDLGVLELQTLRVPVLGAVMLEVPPRRRSRVLHLSRGRAGSKGQRVAEGRLPGPARPAGQTRSANAGQGGDRPVAEADQVPGGATARPPVAGAASGVVPAAPTAREGRP